MDILNKLCSFTNIYVIVGINRQKKDFGSSEPNSFLDKLEDPGNNRK